MNDYFHSLVSLAIWIGDFPASISSAKKKHDEVGEKTARVITSTSSPVPGKKLGEEIHEVLLLHVPLSKERLEIRMSRIGMTWLLRCYGHGRRERQLSGILIGQQSPFASSMDFSSEKTSICSESSR